MVVGRAMEIKIQRWRAERVENYLRRRSSNWVVMKSIEGELLLYGDAPSMLMYDVLDLDSGT